MKRKSEDLTKPADIQEKEIKLELEEKDAESLKTECNNNNVHLKFLLGKLKQLKAQPKKVDELDNDEFLRALRLNSTRGETNITNQLMDQPFEMPRVVEDVNEFIRKNEKDLNLKKIDLLQNLHVLQKKAIEEVEKSTIEMEKKVAESKKKNGNFTGCICGEWSYDPIRNKWKRKIQVDKAIDVQDFKTETDPTTPSTSSEASKS